jgi:hypothetical protein
MKNKLIAIILGFVLTGATSYASDFESFDNFNAKISASGTDTVAGYSTVLKSSDVPQGTTVVFKVEKADGNVFEMPVLAKVNGFVEAMLPDFHTRVAGDYKVYAKPQGGEYGGSSSFKVLSGDLSETSSSVSPTEQVVRIGRDPGEIEVALKDVYGNPISGHMVELISSRAADSISIDDNVSDDDGLVVFTLNSTESGVSTYSIYDLTSGKVLSTRGKVAYFNSNEELFSNTQAYICHAAGSASGPIAYFEIDDMPESVSIGQSLSFTLKALDEANQPVVDYTGTVKFSVASGNSSAVNLPSNYTFVPQDLGVHTFALAANFNSSGMYVVKAEDAASPAVFGTVSVNVVSSSSGASSISVTNPTAGTYSNNVQVISGKATPGAKIVVYDNSLEIGNATADTGGNFQFTSGILVDGPHELFTAIVNGAGVITSSSSKVIITIDTTKPKLEKIEIAPASGLQAGGQVEVKINSETDLSQALVEVNGNVYESEDLGSGLYRSTFKAPQLAGTYPVKITLVDKVGNTEITSNAGSMAVGTGGVSTGNSTGVGAAGSSASGAGVGDVSALAAYAQDHKVVLNWGAPKSGNPVQFYRVYYGLSANQLSFAVDTWTPTTTWYIPDLKNGVEYFFAVAAVDNSGNISAHLSNIVSAVPGSVITPVPPEVQKGMTGAVQLQQMTSDVSQTGPEILYIVLFALMGGLFYSQSKNW